MVFVGTSEVILMYCQNKYISPKRMERNKVQFTILKNFEHFSNQKILNFFLAISLDLVSPIVSKYVKFNLPKNFILSMQFWSCLLILILGSYHGKVSFLIIFIFERFVINFIYLFYCGFMLSGFDKLTQWPLVLFSKNKLTSNACMRKGYVISKSDALVS